MRAGRLKHKILIEEPTAGTADSYGESEYTWTTYATAWADVVPQNAREYIAAQQLMASMTHLLNLQYISGVTSKMRVKLGTRYLNIISAINLGERNRTLQLVCQEAV